MKVFTLLALLGYLKTSSSEFDAPNIWPRIYPTCIGDRQSPVDIKNEPEVKNLPPLFYHGHWNDLVHASLTNTGYTANVTVGNWSSPAFLSGGPLQGKYVFSDMHFHWGVNSNEGSEHALDGRMYSMEVHVIHFKEEYGDLVKALSRDDGIAVVTFFLQAQMELPNDQFQDLCQAVPAITSPRSSVSLPLSSATRWFKESASADCYYTYQGSMTTPPCPEVVTWIIYPRPIDVLESQVAVFRTLKKEEKANIESNFRELYPLNGRIVTHAINRKHHAGCISPIYDYN